MARRSASRFKTTYNTTHIRPVVNYPFLGRISFHSFRGDSDTRVADPVQRNCLAKQLEGNRCPSTILKKGW